MACLVAHLVASGRSAATIPSLGLHLRFLKSEVCVHHTTCIHNQKYSLISATCTCGVCARVCRY